MAVCSLKNSEYKYPVKTCYRFLTSKINVKSVPLLRRSYYKAEPPSVSRLYLRVRRLRLQWRMTLLWQSLFRISIVGMNSGTV